ncbi:MAG: hypothetical protein WDN06_11140 [Asticcacaulis sp.]
MGGALNDIASHARRTGGVTDAHLQAVELLQGELGRWGAALLQAMGRSNDH